MNDLIQVWDNVQEILFQEISEVHYNTWIKPLIPLKKDNSTVYISSIKFIIKMVEQKYKESIENALSNFYQESISVILLDVNSEEYTKIKNQKSEEKSNDIDEGVQINFHLSESIDQIDKNVKQNTPKTYKYKGTLNKKNTFSNFVRGKSNDFALAIALNVAENPGVAYNPFFIYGSSGLGKTHLMQAIGHKILEDDPSKKVIYVTSENFMNEFIATIRDNKNSVINSQIFREKYRNCDVLMIDDIQFISGKESTQEEIFHTFNSLQQAKKQIIFTSDKRPEHIEGLEERLVTRFSGGMVADIQKPDFETRVAILRHKVNLDRYIVPNAVLEFIAEHITTSIRELEGALIKVMAFYQLKSKSNPNISVDDFIEIAKQSLSIKEKKSKPITLDSIKDAVSSYYGLKKSDLIEQNRQKSIAIPRQIAMHLSRQLTNLSLIKIADSFERDHATVIYGDDKVKLLKENDPEIKKELEEIIKIITE